MDPNRETSLNRQPGWLALSLLGLIRVYQLCVSPWLAAFGSCRYEPSCSRYACGAILKHGPFWGALLGMSRLSRCHPFHAGGYDPVPEVNPFRKRPDTSALTNAK